MPSYRLSSAQLPPWIRRALHPAYDVVRSALGPFHSSEYEIRAGYSHRRAYHYFDDRTNTDMWQREVYQRAADIMRAERMRSIVDVGCGSAFKLVTLLAEFETVGVDVSPTYEWLLERYPERRWVKSFTPEASRLTADLVICADVIEHVLDPDALLNYLSSIKPRILILSSPDRDLLYGRHQWGPPSNPSHVREWNFAEFEAYVARHFEIVEHVISNREQFTQMIVARPRQM
jgi:SAM-dependent methyltransferase